MKEAAIGIVFSPCKTKVLLVLRDDVPVWVLPGGGIDPHETSEDAALRELSEETGLNCQIIRKIAFYYPLNKLAKPTHVYECLKKSGDLTLGSETKDLQYFAINNLPSNFFTVHREWLDDALKNLPEINAPIASVTYYNFFKYFLRHPWHVIRFLSTAILKK